MKKIISLVLILALSLAGCTMHPRPVGQLAAPTQAPTEAVTLPSEQPTTEPTTEPTTIPTEPPVVYCNPLNGTVLSQPYTGRLFATTISNIPSALPHVGTNQADIILESFVNGSIVRCLALYTDISQMESIGSTRSTRPMFNDLAQHYDAILLHAGGSSTALHDASSRGIDDFNVEKWDWRDLCSFRDPDREKNLGYEHCLMVKGAGVVENAANLGFRLEQSPDKDYFLRFADDGTPADGSPATTITIPITYNTNVKQTVMIFDPDLGKYVYNQYDAVSIDAATGEPEAFQNVVILLSNVTSEGMYQMVDFVAGGDGFFACGGKLVPITWRCDDDVSPIRLLDANGELLELGRGNTYIAITQPQSAIHYE